MAKWWVIEEVTVIRTVLVEAESKDDAAYQYTTDAVSYAAEEDRESAIWVWNPETKEGALPDWADEEAYGLDKEGHNE